MVSCARYQLPRHYVQLVRTASDRKCHERSCTDLADLDRFMVLPNSRNKIHTGPNKNVPYLAARIRKSVGTTMLPGRCDSCAKTLLRGRLNDLILPGLNSGANEFQKIRILPCYTNKSHTMVSCARYQLPRHYVQLVRTASDGKCHERSFIDRADLDRFMVPPNSRDIIHTGPNKLVPYLGARNRKSVGTTMLLGRCDSCE